MDFANFQLEQLLVFDLKAFLSILAIDLVLSGDNAVIIGMAASGLDDKQKNKVILIGIIAATVFRILFSASVSMLLQIVGLTLAGGLLLLWVTYKTWRDLHKSNKERDNGSTKKIVKRSFTSALLTIIVADVTMSLDNVLAIAGASHGYPGMLIFGLVLSIVLMAFAAKLIANLLENHQWISYVGTAIVGYVALDMIWRGVQEFA